MGFNINLESRLSLRLDLLINGTVLYLVNYEVNFTVK